jgi:ATP synthase mitochondrial F1 complex assembly factor 1
LFRKGLSVDELRESAKESSRKPRILPEAQKLFEQKQATKDAKAAFNDDKNTKWTSSVRKDNSPVKVRLLMSYNRNYTQANIDALHRQPLAQILNIPKLLSSPPSPAQLSALWTAFHASRTNGTGRGYLSACIPLSTYETLVSAGRQHPSFIVPLPRAGAVDTVGEGAASESASAYEFFFMQWAFHPTPPLPRPSILDDPLPTPTLTDANAATSLPTATILFTPLLEYKTRTTFATPHLVLTLYPDLAPSFGHVLLRGEITPTSSSSTSSDLTAGEAESQIKFVLKQEEAQLLALGMQRFYLTGANEKEEERKKAQERRNLVRAFNETPEEFKWEELLKYADPMS